MIKVLFIEDDVFQISLYEVVFRSNDIITTTAISCEDAMTKIIADKPDIILLDIVLAGEDGLAILEKLKKDENAKDIPVIILTNSAKEEIEDNARSLGAVDFIIKSQTVPQEVAESIKKFMEAGVYTKIKRHNNELLSRSNM